MVVIGKIPFEFTNDGNKYRRLETLGGWNNAMEDLDLRTSSGWNNAMEVLENSRTADIRIYIRSIML